MYELAATGAGSPGEEMESSTSDSKKVIRSNTE